MMMIDKRSDSAGCSSRPHNGDKLVCFLSQATWGRAGDLNGWCSSGIDGWRVRTGVNNLWGSQRNGRVPVVKLKGCGHLWIPPFRSLLLVSIFLLVTGCWLTESRRWDMGSSRFVWPWGVFSLHIKCLMCLCCNPKLLFYCLTIFLFYGRDLLESHSCTSSPPFIFWSVCILTSEFKVDKGNDC